MVTTTVACCPGMSSGVLISILPPGKTVVFTRISVAMASSILISWIADYSSAPSTPYHKPITIPTTRQSIYLVATSPPSADTAPPPPNDWPQSPHSPPGPQSSSPISAPDGMLVPTNATVASPPSTTSHRPH